MLIIKNRFNKLFFPHDDKPDHFKSLDGLRGIAVLIVLLSHSSNVRLYFHELANFEKIGKVGVYLFFVLSAYLLDRQIALAFMTKKSSKKYWKNYFFRRFVRIYPLFIVALVFYFVLSWLGLKTVIDKMIDIPTHIFLMGGEGVFWSIPVEFKYYFISPAIMWFCHKYLKWDPLKLLISFMVIICLSIIVQLTFNLSIISTFRYFPIFMVGTFISIIEILFRKNVFEEINPRIFEFLGISSLMIIIITVPSFFSKIFQFEVAFQSSIFYFPYAIMWGMILLSAKYGKLLIKKMLELKLLRFIGSISFSIYLFHKPLLNLVKSVDLPEGYKIYIFFLLSIVFSSVSYLIIERPLSNLRLYMTNITEKNIK